jgi:hypothetical protein
MPLMLIYPLTHKVSHAENGLKELKSAEKLRIKLLNPVSIPPIRKENTLQGK